MMHKKSRQIFGGEQYFSDITVKREGGREGGKYGWRDDCYTYSNRYVQYKFNAMIPQYLNNNMT